MKPLSLTPMAGLLAICRLPAATPIPEWALGGAFLSVTRTPEELSIVCDTSSVPADIPQSGGWMALKVEGPLDFSLTGILADLAGTLAHAGISIFAISTFDTDYLLVRAENFETAADALRGAGYSIMPQK